MLPMGPGAALTAALYAPTRLWGTRDSYRDQLSALA